MRIENHIHIRHIMLYHYEKRWNAAQSFRDLNELFGDNTTFAFLQWTPFGNPLGETPVETQILFLLTFLKRSRDSSPVTRFLRSESLLVSLQQIGVNSDTFCIVVVGEFVGDMYGSNSQFPYFSELFETTNDARIVHIEVFGHNSNYV